MDLSQERQEKRQRVGRYLKEHGLDTLVLSRRCNFSWYTCGAHNYVNSATDAGNSFLVASADGACVLTNNIEGPRLRQEDLAGSGIEVVEYPYHDPAGRQQAFDRRLASGRVAVDAPVPWIKAPLLEKDFDVLRWALTATEIERYRALCTDAINAMEFVAHDAEPGRTEHEVAGMLSGALRCCGIIPWVLLVAGDGRIGQYRHPLPTDLVIDRQFLLVATAERDGLLSACSRMVSFGPVEAELAARHRAVATVDVALMSATRPGAALGDIFAAGQRAYEKVGFADQWRSHHQGGSIGYLPRDVVASPGDKTQALEHQAFAWNPSITGTKSEDTILCTVHGPDLLAPPSDWPTIDAEWQGVQIPRPDILVR